MRYLIKFSYDGTNYYGFQTQKGYPTIQEEMEKAATKINNEKKVDLVASGRTDKGVHAQGQVAHLDLEVSITPYKLKRAMNTNLPPDIHVISAEEVDPSFHCRYQAKEKEYEYRINMGEYDPLKRNYVYQHNYPLLLDKMKEAIKYFEGEHDFRAFVTENKEKENCVRTIKKAKITLDKENKEEVIFTFIGNGFLRYQVRNMVGILLKVGTGKIEPEIVKEVLESKERGKHGSRAPACGLCLKNVVLKTERKSF